MWSTEPTIHFCHRIFAQIRNKKAELSGNRRGQSKQLLKKRSLESSQQDAPILVKVAYGKTMLLITPYSHEKIFERNPQQGSIVTHRYKRSTILFAKSRSEHLHLNFFEILIEVLESMFQIYVWIMRWQILFIHSDQGCNQGITIAPHLLPLPQKNTEIFSKSINENIGRCQVR